MTETKREIYKNIKANNLKLSLEEQMNLFHEYRETGSLSAREKIIKANLKLISQTAYFFIKNWSIKGEDIKDIHQYAYLAAIKSLERFKPEKGESTVPSWIRTCVYNEVLYIVKIYYDSNGELSPVKINSSAKDKMILYNTIKDRLKAKGEEYIVGDKYDYKGKTVILKEIKTIEKASIDEIYDLKTDAIFVTENKELTPLLNSIKKILNEREFFVFYNYYTNLMTEYDLTYKLWHISKQEYKNALERGKNIITVDNNKMFVYYYPFHEEEGDEYTKNQYYKLVFSSPKKVVYNKKTIQPFYDKEKAIYIYDICLKNQGYPLTSMSISNMNRSSMTKVRKFLKKYNIKNISDYESI